MRRRGLLAWIGALALCAALPSSAAIIPGSPQLHPNAMLRSDIIPALHLPHFAAQASPVVCAIGDSTLTTGYPSQIGAAQIAPTEDTYSLLQQALTAAYPDKAITFKNFAVAGTTWATIANLASAGAAGCHLTFVQLGTNDGLNLSPAAMKTALTTIAGWTPATDIMLSSNKVGSTATYNAVNAQRSFLAAQGYTRTLALQGGSIFGIGGLPPLGLIDTGRIAVMARDGYDPTDQYLTQVIAPFLTNIPVNTPYTFGFSTAGDFDLNLTYPDPAAFTVGGHNIVWTLTTSEVDASPGGGMVQQTTVTIANNGAGNFLVTAISGAGSLTGVAGVAVPGTGPQFDVFIKNGMLTVLLVNSNTILFNARVPVFGGGFTQKMSWTGTSISSTVVNINTYSTGTSRTVTPSATDDQMFSTTVSRGGSIGLHMNSYGIDQTDWPAVMGARWR